MIENFLNERITFEELDEESTLVGVLTEQNIKVNDNYELHLDSHLYHRFLFFLRYISLNIVNLYAPLVVIMLLLGILLKGYLEGYGWFGSFVWYSIYFFFIPLGILFINYLHKDTLFIIGISAMNRAHFIPILNSTCEHLEVTNMLNARLKLFPSSRYFTSNQYYDDYIVFAKDYSSGMYFERDIISSPFLHLGSLKSIYIFTGEYMKDNIIPKKRIYFSEDTIKKINKNKISSDSDIIVVLIPQNINHYKLQYPIILSFSDLESLYDFLNNNIIKEITNSGLFIEINYDKEHHTYEDIERHMYEYNNEQLNWFKRNIENKGIHLNISLIQ